MADARMFMPQIVRLGSARAVHLALATRGETVETMAEAMLPGLPPSFALMGQGLGGDIALELIRRVPDRVTRVILLATDPLPEAPSEAAAREARIVAVRAGRLVQAMAQEIPTECLFSSPWREEIQALIIDMAENLGEGVFIRQSRALQRRPDQQKTMRWIKLPALVLAGRSDTLVPLRRQEFTANLMPFGQFHIIEDAGHLPSLEQPDQVTDLIEAFLNGPVLLR